MNPHAIRRGEKSNALSKMASGNPAPSPPESRFFTGAVHLSEAQVAVGVVDVDHRVVIQAKCPTTGAASSTTLSRKIPAILARLVRSEHLSVFGIGITFSWAINPSSGNYGNYFLTNRQQNLVQDLEETFQLRVAMESDFYACALAEAKWGALHRHPRVLYLDVGPRIVRGTVLDQKNFDQGSHPLVEHDAPGYSQQLASLVSEDAMVAWFKRNAARHRNQSIGAKEIFTMAIRGQVSAQRASVRESINLARGLADLIKIHRPTAVVLGGRVFEEVPDLISAIRHVINSCLLVPYGPVELALTSFGSDSNLIAAAALWHHTFAS